ncbi:hypothetical protein JCM18899A_34180 [Nocardioides sp. AN3]
MDPFDAVLSLPLPLSEQPVRASAVVTVMTSARMRIVTPFAGANRIRFGGSAVARTLSPMVGLPCLNERQV